MVGYTDIGRKACTIENLRAQIAELWERTLHVVTSINTALPDGDGHVVLTLADFPEVSIIQGDVDALEEALQTLAQAHSELKSYVTSIGQDLAHLEGDVAALESTAASLTQSVAGLSVDTATLAADAQLTVRELSTEGSATAVKVKGVRKNSTATPGVSLPVASASSAGVLNAADYTGLKGLIPRVEALEYGVQPEPVPVGTWSLEEEGLIKGSELDGQLYPEADGTGSVVGWDNVTDGISALEAVTEGLVADVDNLTDNLAGLASDVETLEGSVGTVVADLGAKQDKLTFDSVPAAGSDNPVKSGGIYDALMTLDTDLKAYIEEQVFLAMPQVRCSDLLTMFKGDTSLIETSIIKAIGCTSMLEVFKGCINLKTVNRIIAPNVTSMSSMFFGCSSLTSIPEMDTSNVTNMSYMFRECSSLTSIPEMDTSNVTNMVDMFEDCSSLAVVPELNISSVTSMTYMFYGCSSLTSVTFTGNRVPTYGQYMFRETPIASGQGSIFVTDNMVSSYKSASGWSAHANIIKGISEKP